MTLVELVLALTILGLVLAAAAPAVGGLRDRYRVTTAAAEIAGAHHRARIRAVLESQVTQLEIRSDSLLLRLGTSPAGTLLWQSPGPLASGVTLLSPSRTLLFAPTGVTLGFANATFVVARGSARRQVVVSRLGRVRILP